MTNISNNIKILFLDFDGVLNSQKWYKKRFEENIDRNTDSSDFDPEAIENLNYLLRQIPDLHIVVSSTWRVSYDIIGLEWLLKSVGLECDGKVIGKTPTCVDRIRGVEIKKWLQEQKDLTYNFKHYVIIDDDQDMLLRQKEHFFQTSWEDGLTKEIVNRVIDFFKNETINRTVTEVN